MECGIGTLKLGLKTCDYENGSWDPGLWSGKFGLESMDLGLWTWEYNLGSITLGV